MTYAAFRASSRVLRPPTPSRLAVAMTPGHHVTRPLLTSERTFFEFGRNRWPNCGSYCPNTPSTMWNDTGRLATCARTAISAITRLSRTPVATSAMRATDHGRSNPCIEPVLDQRVDEARDRRALREDDEERE